jgi:hypothetical protein
MVRKLKATSIAESIPTQPKMSAVAESGKGNGIRKGRKSKLADPAMPAVVSVQGDAAAPAGRRRPARRLDVSGHPVQVAEGRRPSKAPQRRKPSAAAPATEVPAAPHDAAIASPAHAIEPAVAARPAAQWNRTTDTVRFDWPEIEQTASRDGPHQGMAKLLMAARAQGANSRWPL